MRKLKLYQLLALTLALGLAGFLIAPLAGNAKPHKQRHLLFFTLSAGFKHASIPTGEQVIKQIGEKSGAFDTTISQDVSVFTTENLKHFDAIMFYTTGELPMTDAEKAAFINFVHSGHGFVGVHSATDTFYKWEPYLELVGA